MPSNLVLMDDNFLVGIEFPGTTKQSMIKYVTSFCHSHTSAVFLPLIYATNLIQLHACISFDEKKSYLTFLEVTYQKHSLQGNVGFRSMICSLLCYWRFTPTTTIPSLTRRYKLDTQKNIFLYSGGSGYGRSHLRYTHTFSQL